MSAISGRVLAWASIDADAWTSTLYLASRVLSAAMSTSMIRPLAASRLLCCLAISSEAKRRSGHGCSVVRTQGGNVLHRLSEDSHGDVRKIDRTCGIFGNEGHVTRIGISLVARWRHYGCHCRKRLKLDVVCGDGEGREEQGLVHADLRSGVALRGHDHVHRVVQGKILIEIVEHRVRSSTNGRGGCEQTDPVELDEAPMSSCCCKSLNSRL